MEWIESHGERIVTLLQWALWYASALFAVAMMVMWVVSPSGLAIPLSRY